MQISKRLNEIISFIEKEDKVADIGTDHGFVPNFIVNEKISSYVVSSDISENSLKKSIELTKEYGNEDKIFNRVGAGLSVLNKNEVDTVIIAGMGGILISEIIEEDFEIAKNLKKLILQPMQAQRDIRIYLYSKGFSIVDEKIIYEDRKYFEIIVTKYTGNSKISDEIFYEIPEMPYKRKDKIIYDYLENRISYNEMLLNSLKKSSDLDKVKDKIKETENFVNKCKELLNGI